MIRLPGTGIPLRSPDIGQTAIIVCGENPRDIFTVLSEQLKGWRVTDLSWGCREFYFRSYINGAQSLSVLVGGLGSASVELILQEGTLAGVKKFILTGSCASLNDQIPVGSLVLPQQVCLRPGAFSEYSSDQLATSANTALQKKLQTFMDGHRYEFVKVKHLSTDAFYGIGASYNKDGVPCYAGAPLKNSIVPESVGLALSNPLLADSLDMECAPFFALGNMIADIDVAAVKVVSNKIPWRAEEFNEEAIGQSLKKAILTSLEFALSIL